MLRFALLCLPRWMADGWKARWEGKDGSKEGWVLLYLCSFLFLFLFFLIDRAVVSGTPFLVLIDGDRWLAIFLPLLLHAVVLVADDDGCRGDWNVISSYI
jgi:hypothetical protein